VYSFSHQSAKPNADGTITIHFSSKRPEGKGVLNWLPAGNSTKDGRPQLILRLYKPHQDLQKATATDSSALVDLFEFPVVTRTR